MKSRSRQQVSDMTNSYPGRLAVVSAILIVGFVIVLLRLFQLQILNGSEMMSRAARQHHKVVALNSSRGLIQDSQGRALALNVDVPSVFAHPSEIDDPHRRAQQLSKILDLSPKTLEDRLRQRRDFVWIKRKIGKQEAKKISALGENGLGLVWEKHRFYPKGELLSHALGFAGIDSQGLEGIENRYESYLRGDVRKIRLQRDGFGRTIFPQERMNHSIAAGNTVTLTVDEVIQFIAEQALDAAVKENHARGGIIIVMDPQTGAILGWALRPTFDPNRRHSVSPDIWRNRAVTDPYEPGSTLKMVVAAAALEEEEFELGTLIYAGNGEIPISGTVIHDHQKAGWLTFEEALTRSSNVASVKIALSLGKERLHRYFRAFGFGERTEVDLPGESAGLLKPPKEWGKRTLASLAIGQEIGVTPLQMTTAVSAIANQGWLMKPYVVKEVRDAQGNLQWSRSPEVRRRPILDRTAKTLIALMTNAVEKGTGRRAAIPHYRVAGKTGTAQKVDPKTGQYSSTQLVSSFVGFVPAEEPKVTILVLIDEPQGPGWGGLVAAPVFRQVAEQVLRHFQISPRQESAEIKIARVW